MHMGYLERGWRTLKYFVVHYEEHLCDIFLIFSNIGRHTNILQMELCWDEAIRVPILYSFQSKT